MGVEGKTGDEKVMRQGEEMRGRERMRRGAGCHNRCAKLLPLYHVT